MDMGLYMLQAFTHAADFLWESPCAIETHSNYVNRRFCGQLMETTKNFSAYFKVAPIH